MDYEKKHRIQKIRVVITESVMTIAVIFLTFAFAMIVSGYWVNSDLTVEQKGFLQVYSIPRGATVQVDNDTWISRTNASQMLSAGEHEITLTRDGYDSWTKKINIKEGVLYRLRYPRLFKTNLATTTTTTSVSTTNWSTIKISHSSKKMLLINNSTEWSLVELTNETITPKGISVKGIFDDEETGIIVDYVEWNYDDDKVLVNANSQWVLIDLNKTSNSFNLDQEFGVHYSSVQMIDSAANNLAVIEDGDLRIINVGDRAETKILAKNVSNLTSYDDVVFYDVFNVENNTHTINYYANEKDNIMKTVAAGTKVVFGKFYDENYITIYEPGYLTIYKGKYTDDEEKFEIAYEGEIDIDVTNIKMGNDGNFVFMTDGYYNVVLDMEEMKLSKYAADENSAWLDDSMLYAVVNGSLVVYDYDGLNRRTLIEQNAIDQYPATITDDKYLYYFTAEKLVQVKL